MLGKMFKTLVNKTICNTKMVIVVRSDLNMGKGKIASQAAHAAVSLVLESNNNSYLAPWIRTGQAKVILKSDSADEIKELYESARNCGLNSCAIRDAGRTQVESGALTAVGIGPASVEQVDKLTKHLKLL